MAVSSAGALIELCDTVFAPLAIFFARVVIQVLGNGVFLVGVMALLFHEDWRVGGLLSVCALMALVFMTRGGGFAAVRSKTAPQSAAELTRYLQEQPRALPHPQHHRAAAYPPR